MKSPAEDIKDLLVSAGIGTFGASSGWSLNVSRTPAAPDTCVTVYDSGGRDPHPAQLLDHPSIMVQVRGAKNGYAAGYAKAQEVKDALIGIADQTVNGTRYTGIWMKGDINPMGYDESNRPLFTLNFAITREPYSGTHRESL
jgi:hypothetical protein